MKKVKCPCCRASMRRNGRTGVGAQRWRCETCGALKTVSYDGSSRLEMMPKRSTARQSLRPTGFSRLSSPRYSAADSLYERPCGAIAGVGGMSREECLARSVVRLQARTECELFDLMAKRAASDVAAAARCLQDDLSLAIAVNEELPVLAEPKPEPDWRRLATERDRNLSLAAESWLQTAGMEQNRTPAESELGPNRHQCRRPIMDECTLCIDGPFTLAQAIEDDDGLRVRLLDALDAAKGGAERLSQNLEESGLEDNRPNLSGAARDAIALGGFSLTLCSSIGDCASQIILARYFVNENDLRRCRDASLRLSRGEIPDGLRAVTVRSVAGWPGMSEKIIRDGGYPRLPSIVRKISVSETVGETREGLKSCVVAKPDIDGFYWCVPVEEFDGDVDGFFARFSGFSETNRAHYRTRKMLLASVEDVDESLLAVDSKIYGKILIPGINELAFEWTGLPVDRVEPTSLSRRLNEAIIDAAAAHDRNRQAEQS